LDDPNDQNWGLDWHCNEGLEIGYLSAGRLPFSVDDNSYQVESGKKTSQVQTSTKQMTNEK